MPTFSHKTVILCNGDFPRSPIAKEAIATARHIICCDAAAVFFYRRFHRKPDVIVGDLDSLPPTFRRRYCDIIVQDPGQEDNDLAKAFSFCLKHRWRDVVILGATGKREDHTIANIAWLADFSRKAPRVAMLSDYGLFSVVQAPGGVVATEPGMQISFFCFNPRQRLSATGVKFPVKDLPMSSWHSAALNEATGRKVSLKFEGDPIIVFRVDASLH